jgi:hypothetical protein
MNGLRSPTRLNTYPVIPRSALEKRPATAAARELDDPPQPVGPHLGLEQDLGMALGQVRAFASDPYGNQVDEILPGHGNGGPAGGGRSSE